MCMWYVESAATMDIIDLTQDSDCELTKPSQADTKTVSTPTSSDESSTDSDDSSK